MLQTSDRKVCHGVCRGKWESHSSLTGSLVCLVLYSSWYSAVCQYYSVDGLIVFMPGSDSNGLQGFAGVTAKKAGN